MKIVHYTFIILFSGILMSGGLTVSAQTSAGKSTIAKNSREAAEKKAPVSSDTAPGTAATGEKPAILPSTGELVNRVGVDVEQNVSLSLNDAIRKALENNNDIEVSKQAVKIAESSLRSLLGIYDPVFSLSPGYRDVVQPVTSTFGGGGSSGSTSSKDITLNGGYSHFIKPGGGSYNVFFDNDRSQTSATFSQFTPTYNTSLGINYTQPLFRNFRIDNTRRNIRIQRKRVSQSDADFRTRTIDTIAQVQNSYWNLVFALRDQQNTSENLDLTKENLRQVLAKIEAGSSAPLEKYEVLTELANRQAAVITAAQQVAVAENALKQLLIRDPDSPEWSNQLIPVDQPIVGDSQVDLDAVVKDAIANRPELSRLRLDHEINDINLQFFRNQLKPRVDLNTSFSLAGLAGTPTGSVNSLTIPLIAGDPSSSADAFLLQQLRLLNPGIIVPNVLVPSSVNPTFVGGFGKSLKNLFSTDFRTFQVGVTIEFPLRNKTAKADLAGAEAERTQIEASTRSREQVVIVEVRNAVQALEASRQRVLAAREAVKNGEEQLKGQRKLYELGRSDTFLLFQRENQLAIAKNDLSRAETDYNKAVADLPRATSTTLTVNNIQIASPVAPSN
jgi:outer membrane protein TolC